jgi:hypothetical protein
MADPSNRDANKGIVDPRYQPYQPLLDAMKQINDRAYSLAACFAATAKNNPHNEVGGYGQARSGGNEKIPNQCTGCPFFHRWRTGTTRSGIDHRGSRMI